MPKITFTAPVRIESEMNRREHGAKRGVRFIAQKRAVFYTFLTTTNRIRARNAEPLPTPATVTITRIAPRPITDDDNLISGCKAVRDQIATCCGWNDGDKQIRWEYDQERGKPKEYAVRVEITYGETT